MSHAGEGYGTLITCSRELPDRATWCPSTPGTVAVHSVSWSRIAVRVRATPGRPTPRNDLQALGSQPMECLPDLHDTAPYHATMPWMATSRSAVKPGAARIRVTPRPSSARDGRTALGTRTAVRARATPRCPTPSTTTARSAPAGGRRSGPRDIALSHALDGRGALGGRPAGRRSGTHVAALYEAGDGRGPLGTGSMGSARVRATPRSSMTKTAAARSLPGQPGATRVRAMPCRPTPATVATADARSSGGPHDASRLRATPCRPTPEMAAAGSATVPRDAIMVRARHPDHGAPQGKRDAVPSHAGTATAHFALGQRRTARVERRRAVKRRDGCDGCGALVTRLAARGPGLRDDAPSHAHDDRDGYGGFGNRTARRRPGPLRILLAGLRQCSHDAAQSHARNGYGALGIGLRGATEDGEDGCGTLCNRPRPGQPEGARHQSAGRVPGPRHTSPPRVRHPIL